MLKNEDLYRTISALAEKIIENHPALKDIMDRAAEGFITEEEAMAAIATFTIENPAVESELLALALTEPYSTMTLDELSEVPKGLFQSRPDGLLRMNPLVEAALAERAQFDGDMPELRTGQMTEGVRPSVSVDTDARNPVAVGRMLDKAADEMGEKVAAHEGGRRQLIEQVAMGDKQALALVEKHGELVRSADGTPDTAAMLRGSAETDLPEYRRGQVPAPVKTAKPTGAELLLMTPKERQQAAWGFLSTTQGRRSGVATVRHLVAEGLRKKGLAITERDFDKATPAEEPVALHEWTVSLGGAAAHQESFSIVDTAACVLVAALIKQVPEGTKDFILEVTTADRLEDRAVGWRGRLLGAGAPQ